MAKNKFLRTCVVCREAKNKDELYRFTIVNNEIIVDYFKKLEGRGFYVCKNGGCLKNLTKKAAAKSLKKDGIIFNKEKILKTLKNVIKGHIYNTIKICNKSGNIEATLNRIANATRDIYGIVIARDCSMNTFKKLEKFLKDRFVIRDLFNKKELGEIFDKDEVAVLGITDKKFCERLEQLYTEYLGV